MAPVRMSHAAAQSGWGVSGISDMPRCSNELLGVPAAQEMTDTSSGMTMPRDCKALTTPSSCMGLTSLMMESTRRSRMDP